MKKKQQKNASENPVQNPSERMRAKSDSRGRAEYPVTKPEEAGIRVEDNCAEEHQM